jgi:hypothetical protein
MKMGITNLYLTSTSWIVSRMYFLRSVPSSVAVKHEATLSELLRKEMR